MAANVPRARVKAGRVRTLKEGKEGAGPVVYWMSRDQRTRDNWALLHAQERALLLGRPLAVAFCLAPEFLGAARRQYDFMLRGLAEVEEGLRRKAIPFVLLRGDPGEETARFAARAAAAEVICDFDPLRIKWQWKKAAADGLSVPLREVDAHNLIPAWIASGRQEYAARTFRPKVHRLLPGYLEEFPSLKRHPHRWEGGAGAAPDWDRLRRSLRVDGAVPPVPKPVPGEKRAAAVLKDFVGRRLGDYPGDRNDPARDGQSGLSAYLHFGQLSAQRVVLEIKRSGAPKGAKEAFLEELVVRRELADNFCLYQEHYDRVEGFPEWARRTLSKHRRDKRPHIYSLPTLEEAKTHDPLWNAAQTQMVRLGRMHGYLRMYWGKKILEWTASPEEALAAAIELNDRYELDGRDPNGYTGIAWCMGGVHDRPWPERPVFGTVRTMTFEGCRRKFDVRAYIDMVQAEG